MKNRRFKCAIAERAIRTIKAKIYKYFTQNNTLTYIDILKQIEHSHNISAHKGLGYETPNMVHSMKDLDEVKKQENIQLIQKFRNYGSISKRERKKVISRGNAFEVGGYVRLLLNSAEGIFSKSYEAIFTEEIFIIRHVEKTLPISYWLKDLKGQHIDGIVYEYELKPTTLPETFAVEKILKTEIDKDTKKN